MPKWVKKWTVPSNSNPDKSYVVSQAEDGTWGCSCPHWKFRRQECSHIAHIQATKPDPNGEVKPKPTIIPAKVFKPTYKPESNELWMPLIPLNPNSVNVTATICYVAMKYGYSITELRDRYHLPSSWTKETILNHIEKYGEYELPKDYYDKW